LLLSPRHIGRRGDETAVGEFKFAERLAPAAIGVSLLASFGGTPSEADPNPGPL
jgi:hypothetical protein